MNKPIFLATVTIVLLMGVAFVFPAVEIAYGQYVSEAPSNVEEQLKLAKEKVANAKTAGAYGSGTSMFGTGLSETVIMVALLAAIFGGVAAAFFIKGRSGRKEAATR
jgi:uncharacterized membrane protein